MPSIVLRVASVAVVLWASLFGVVVLRMVQLNDSIRALPSFVEEQADGQDLFTRGQLVGSTYGALNLGLAVGVLLLQIGVWVVLALRPEWHTPMVSAALAIVSSVALLISGRMVATNFSEDWLVLPLLFAILLPAILHLAPFALANRLRREEAQPPVYADVLDSGN